MAAFPNNLIILLKRKWLSCGSVGIGLQTHLTSETAGDDVRLITLCVYGHGLEKQWLALSQLVAFIFQAIPKHNLSTLWHTLLASCYHHSFYG